MLQKIKQYDSPRFDVGSENSFKNFLRQCPGSKITTNPSYATQHGQTVWVDDYVQNNMQVTGEED